MSKQKTSVKKQKKSVRFGQKKKAMLAALERSLGVVTSACKAAEISRDTHYRWLKEDENYRKAVDELESVALDFVESKLHQQISQGNTSATIFFLKTKGKSRGYVERHELTGENGSELKATVQVVGAQPGQSVEELQELEQADGDSAEDE